MSSINYVIITWPDFSLVVSDAVSLFDPDVLLHAAVEGRVGSLRLLVADARVQDNNEPVRWTLMLVYDILRHFVLLTHSRFQACTQDLHAVDANDAATAWNGIHTHLETCAK